MQAVNNAFDSGAEPTRENLSSPELKWKTPQGREWFQPRMALLLQVE